MYFFGSGLSCIVFIILCSVFSVVFIVFGKFEIWKIMCIMLGVTREVYSVQCTVCCVQYSV